MSEPTFPAQLTIQPTGWMGLKVHPELVIGGDRLAMTDDPEEIAGDNLLRAAWAARGLITFCSYTMPSSNEDVQTSMQDFLANLMHLCDALELQWDEVVYGAENHYADELHGRY